MAALEGNSMKDLLLYIARNLVANPDAVSVTEVEKDGELTLQLRVEDEAVYMDADTPQEFERLLAIADARELSEK